MKNFEEHAFDLTACRNEVLELRELLRRPVLKEQEHIRPFFRRRRHLSALCGLYNPGIARFDRLAWEFPLFGDWSCDLVVGDSVKETFSFIELEDAGPNSIFVWQGKKSTREWSPQLDHGCSQIIDWFYKLRDAEKSDELEARFGQRSIDYTGTLIIGRDRYLDTGERARLDWRRHQVLVNSRRIQCVSFDELLEDLLYRVKTFPRLGPGGK
jgi:hypothetical protein